VIDRDHQKVVKVVGPSSLNHSKCPTPHSIAPPYSPKLDIYALKEDPVQLLSGLILLSPHLGSRGRNLQSTGCVLGGKPRVEILSLNTQLLRLGQLLAKPRGVVPKK
jgi:hypothetical protein